LGKTQVPHRLDETLDESLYRGGNPHLTNTTCKYLNYLFLELTIFELGPSELMCGYQLKLYLSSNPFFMRGLNT